MVGGGVITLLFELSDGIGWALLVFGAWFLVPVIGSAVRPSSTAPGDRSSVTLAPSGSAKRARLSMDMTTPTRQAGCHGN
jgi:hypothetical protein